METGGDEGLIERVVDSKDLQQQSKAFDKLTDRVEDRQLDSTRVQERSTVQSQSSIVHNQINPKSKKYSIK
ncbi:hypothetical protein SO802_007120 [Lithocarpus litseifolius]|uniref:Uncharacterized protein n=1 Tax=Lithocarpus litseifolius TaxID=425828 RepID=A0AAW2DN45_9ROSI